MRRMFRLVRTALPVGQGAFYCERFMDTVNKKVRNIVYDCGALDNNRQKPASLTREINGLLDKDEHIDILFISHFDADHVNGIAQLNGRNPIDRIVMPELTKNEIWFLYAFGAVNGQFAEMADFANFYNSYQGQTIYISSVDEEDDSREADDGRDLLGDVDNNVQNGAITESSGTKFSLGTLKEQLSWIYVPINYGISQKKLQDLKAKILDIQLADGSKLTEDDLKIGNKVGEVTDAIKKAFKDSKVDTNMTSMVVYSGPSISLPNYDICYCQRRLDIEDCFHCLYWDYDFDHQVSACLYTGDSVLNAKRCKSIAGFIKSIKDNIGTLQLPHHGSNNNFWCDIYEDEFKTKLSTRIFCFASYGVDNIFRHPSSKVRMDLILHGTCLWGVTEEKHTQFNECIFIDY